MAFLLSVFSLKIFLNVIFHSLQPFHRGLTVTTMLQQKTKARGVVMTAGSLTNQLWVEMLLQRLGGQAGTAQEEARDGVAEHDVGFDGLALDEGLAANEVWDDPFNIQG